MRRECLALASLLIATVPALAHKLEVRVWLADDRLNVEATYDEPLAGKPAPVRQARVRLLDGTQVTAEGRTDDLGRWTCPTPPPGDYTLEVRDVGHAARKRITIPSSGGQLQVRSEAFDHLPGAEHAVPPKADSPEPRRFPVVKVALGLGVITLLALTVWWALHNRSQRPPADQTEPRAPSAT